MSEINGILNIRKPPGMTSFQVVSAVRKIMSCKKAGHTGTLDPTATGVLPVCLGKATKIIPYIPEEEKEYLADITLGVVTDTLDSEGKVLAENMNWQKIDLKKLRAVLQEFQGKIKQIPPMYSALHYEGKRLYQLARQGKNVERKAREIYIKEIELLEFKPPLLKIRVLCSKGTYIRTLADDLGKKLGVGAHLSALVRSKSGPFSLADSVNLEELVDNNFKYLLPVDFPLKLSKLYVKEEAVKFASNGVELYRHNFSSIPDDIRESLSAEQLVAIYYNKLFISISMVEKYCKENEELVIKPIRVFNINI